MKYLGYLEDQVPGVWGELTTSERRVELTAVRHVAGFRRYRYFLEGERILFLLLFLLKATQIYPYGLRLLRLCHIYQCKVGYILDILLIYLGYMWNLLL